MWNCWEVKQNLWEYLFKRFSCFEGRLIKVCETLKDLIILQFTTLPRWTFYDVFGFIPYQDPGFPRTPFLFSIIDNSVHLFYQKKDCGIRSGYPSFAFFCFFPTGWSSAGAFLHMCCLTRIPRCIPDGVTVCERCWALLSSLGALCWEGNG